MKRAGRLMERVIERDNLRLAFWKAARGKRTKRDAAPFAARLDGNLEDLARELDEETYAAGPYHQFTIYDPKQRLITAPSFRDRVVHHAGRAEGDIVNCKSVLSKMGSLSVSSYSLHSMRAIYYVPLGPPTLPVSLCVSSLCARFVLPGLRSGSQPVVKPGRIVNS